MVSTEIDLVAEIIKNEIRNRKKKKKFKGSIIV